MLVVLELLIVHEGSCKVYNYHKAKAPGTGIRSFETNQSCPTPTLECNETLNVAPKLVEIQQ